jgi:hypothetical protein
MAKAASLKQKMNDFDGNGNVDGLDLAELIGKPDLPILLPGFATEFGRNDCP